MTLPSFSHVITVTLIVNLPPFNLWPRKYAGTRYYHTILPQILAGKLLQETKMAGWSHIMWINLRIGPKQQIGYDEHRLHQVLECIESKTVLWGKLLQLGEEVGWLEGRGISCWLGCKISSAVLTESHRQLLRLTDLLWGHQKIKNNSGELRKWLQTRTIYFQFESRWSSRPCVKSYLVVKPVEVAKVSVELVFRVLTAEMQRHGHNMHCILTERGPHVTGCGLTPYR